MLERIIIAGAGGQGNLFLGKILCLAAIKEEKNATWFPSYGPAMRGGKSTCMVVISDEEIDSYIVKSPDALIVMNKPSLYFIKDVDKGIIIINQSLAKYDSKIVNSNLDINLIETESILKEIDDKNGQKALNMLLLGVYLKKRKIISIENILRILKEENEKFFNINKMAVLAGYDYLK